jgi:hypothetical protein
VVDSTATRLARVASAALLQAGVVPTSCTAGLGARRASASAGKFGGVKKERRTMGTCKV